MADQTEIIAYNTHLFDGTIAKLYKKLVYKDKERLTEIIARIRKSRSEIICLCEVWSDAWKHYIAECVEDKYPYNFYLNTTWTTIGDGLLILSKKSLYNPDFIEFSDSAGDDAHARKGVLMVCVSWSKDKQFRVFMSHTQSGSKYWDVRKCNLEQIRKAVDNYYPDTPAIVLGDLNVYKGEQAELMKIFKGFEDLGAAAGTPTYDPSKNNVAKHFSPKGRARRLDFILTTDADWSTKSYEVIENWKNKAGLDCSDHYPIDSKSILITSTQIPANVFATEKQATKAAEKAKKRYGYGVSDLVRIGNTTKSLEIRPHALYSWPMYGNFRYLFPAPIVAHGEWTAAFHHHPDGESRGSIGCVIYRLFKDDDTAVCDVFLGFDTPWGAYYKNKVYVEARQCGHWWKKGSKSHMYYLMTDKKGAYTSSDTRTFRGMQIKVSGKIDKGTSPATRFVISSG